MEATNSDPFGLLSKGLSRVGTDQRSLINKLLVRYPQQFTEFRELIQNANDAGATEFVIQWYNDRLVCKNNGKAFSAHDWNRLTTIARGNPDESKIGCFGVGFFSIFLLTDAPVVASGHYALHFYWKDDEVNIRPETNPDPDPDKRWTSFTCPFHKPRELQNRWRDPQFRLFLAKMVAFTESVRRIMLLVDDIPQFVVDKQFVGEPRSIDCFRCVSPGELIELRPQMTLERIKLSVKWGQEAPATLMYSLLRGTATVLIEPGNTTYDGILATTQKSRLPTATPMSLIFRTYLDYNESTEVPPGPWTNALSPIRPDGSAQGRVSFGFFSQQLTGAGFHANLYVFSTYDRENLDFENLHVAAWNENQVFVAGSMSRAFYDHELKRIHSTVPESERDLHYEHLFRSFPFVRSTPKKEVKSLLLNGFCNPAGLVLAETPVAAFASFFRSLFTERKAAKSVSFEELLVPFVRRNADGSIAESGIMPCSRVRIPAQGIDKLISVPILPACLEAIATSPNSRFFKAMKKQGMQELSVGDLVAACSQRVLPVPAAMDILRWALAQKSMPRRSRGELFAALKFALPAAAADQPPGPVVSFGTMRYFALHEFDGLPLPASCLPHSVSAQYLSTVDLQNLGLEQLTVGLWWSFLSGGRQSFDLSPQVAPRVLQLLSSTRDRLPPDCLPKLRESRCVPAKTDSEQLVCMLPAQVYFAEVTMLEGLPHVQLDNVPRDFLRAIGVRDKISLKDIFDALSNKLQWNEAELFEYLLKNYPTFTADDWKTLKEIPFVPVTEGGGQEVRKVLGRDAYQPTKDMVALGLPVVHLPTLPIFQGQHDSAGPVSHPFFQKLGVRSYPSLQQLLDVAAYSGPRRPTALQFFLHHFKFYKDTYVPSQTKQPFVPTDRGYKTPLECYTKPNPFGYPVVETSIVPFAVQLGVATHPPLDALIDRFLTDFPPADALVSYYAYFALRSNEFSDQHRVKLMKNKCVYNSLGQRTYPIFVCVRTKKLEDTFGDLLDYVDYGTLGNQFMKLLGVSDTAPLNPLTMGYLLIKNSQRYFKSVGAAQYMRMLDQICLKYFDDFLPDTKAKMREMPIIMAQRLGASEKDPPESRWCAATECYMVDNRRYATLFRPFSVDPSYTGLEKLDIRWLSTAITTTIRPDARSIVSERCRQLEALVHERTPLLVLDSNNRRKHHLRDDAEAVLSGMTFREVKTMRRVLKFEGLTAEEEAKAGYVEAGNTMYISPSMNNLSELAGQLVRAIFARDLKHTLEEGSLLLKILTVDLDTLRAEGWPIDRILRKSVEPAVNVRPPEEPPPTPTPLAASASKSSAAAGGPSPAVPSAGQQPQPRPADQAQLQPQQQPPPSLDATSQRPPAAATAAPAPPRDVPPAAPKPDVPPVPPPAVMPPPPLPAAAPRRASSGEPKGLRALLPSFLGGSSSPKHSHATRSSSRSEASGSGPPAGAAPSPRPQPTEPPEVLPPEPPERRVVETFRDERSGPDHDPVASAGRTDADIRALVQSVTSAGAAPSTYKFSDKGIITRIQHTCVQDEGTTTLVGRTSHRVPIYFYQRGAEAPGSAVLPPFDIAAADSFGHLLLMLADQVFGLPAANLHIYYGGNSNKIAYNRGKGQLFFNLDFFRGLHCRQDASSWQDAVVYWYIVCCHELAHQATSEHDEHHEYVMQRTIGLYFGQLLPLLNASGAAGGRTASAPAEPPRQSSGQSATALQQLVDMFGADAVDRCRVALAAANGKLDEAVNSLLSER